MGSATGYQLYQIKRLKHLTANRKVAASNPQGRYFQEHDRNRKLQVFIVSLPDSPAQSTQPPAPKIALHYPHLLVG